MRKAFQFTTLKRTAFHASIMKSSVSIHPCAYALILLGTLVSAFPLFTADPDSRDSPSALLSDRCSEQIRLGIRLLPYHIAGTVAWALAGNLLTIKRKKNPFDSISLDSFSPVPLPTGTMKRLEDAMNSIARTEEASDLAREIALVNGASSRKTETKASPASQKMDTESIDSLIDGACSLLPDERPVKVELKASRLSARKLTDAYRQALKRIDGLIDPFLNRKS